MMERENREKTAEGPCSVHMVVPLEQKASNEQTESEREACDTLC